MTRFVGGRGILGEKRVLRFAQDDTARVLFMFLPRALSRADQECQDEGENEAEYKDCSAQ